MAAFAVDDGGVVDFFVLLNRVPDLGHPGAGGVYNGGVARSQQLQFLKGGSCARNDYDVFGFDLGEVFFAVGFGDEFDRHFPEFLIDKGVVDDFSGDPDARAWKVGAGFVGHADGAFDAPTEAHGFGEMDGDLALGELVAVGTDGLDDFALVVGLKLGGASLAEGFVMVIADLMEGAAKFFGIDFGFHGNRCRINWDNEAYGI
jgi:hypothetical protein